MHPVVGFFENDELRNALEERNHYARREQFEAQRGELLRLEPWGRQDRTAPARQFCRRGRPCAASRLRPRSAEETR